MTDKAMSIQVLNEEVRALAGHIKNCVPNGQKLQNNEALALARIAMATKLSPFTGELFYIPGKGPHVGIEGLRRKAREQSAFSGQARPMRTEEREEHTVRDNDIGYIFELYRHDLTRQAVEINKMANEVIIPIKPICGVGVWRKAWPEVGQRSDDPVPKGRSPAWVAQKRAEADALRKGYDLGLNMPYGDEPASCVEVANGNGAWSVVPEEITQREAAMNAERAAQVQEWPPRPWGLATVGDWFDARLAEDDGKPLSESQRKYILGALGKLGDDATRHTITLYLYDVESSKDLSAAQAAALIDWTEATAANDFTPPPYVVQEAEAMVRQYRLAKGQQEMDLSVDDAASDAPRSMEELYERAVEEEGLNPSDVDGRICEGTKFNNVQDAVDVGWTPAELWLLIKGEPNVRPG